MGKCIAVNFDGIFSYNSLLNMHKQTAIVKAEPSIKENAKLVGIFLFLIISATLMGAMGSINAVEWLRWFMGGLLIIFGGLKLLGIEVFIKVFPLFDLLAKRVRPYKYIYPFVQVLFGIFFIVGAWPLFRNLATIVIGLSGLIGMINVVIQRGAVRLSYLGTILRLRFSTVILIENTLMVCLSVIMLISELIV